MLRRAALSVALQTAFAVALVVAAVSVLAFLINGREQSARAKDAVRSAALAADDVTDPPAGVILLEYDRGVVKRSSNTPEEAHQINLSIVDSGMHKIHLGHSSYQMYVTGLHNSRRYAALTSLTVTGEDRHRLLDALLLAGAGGVLGSALVGGVIGWRAARPLGRALALQRRFVADASHELRTPLTVLHTRAQLLARRAGRSTDPVLTEQAHDLISDTRALGDVVEDLLLAAQLEHRSDRSEPVDLAEIVAEVERIFAVHAQMLDVTLDVKLADPPPFLIRGVHSALRRALSALVDNALAHEHAGGTVVVSLQREKRLITMTVADDGSGLDPADAGRLTERFVRGTDPPDSARRFGIGLALVHEVVHAHHGTMDISGAPGAGAQFRLTFPVE